MRILHVISNLMSGGAESMLTKVVEALPAPRFEHAVVTFVNGGLFADRLGEAGVPIFGLGQQKGQAARALLRLSDVRRIVEEFQPDILQGWMYHGNLAASVAAGRRPVIWNVRQRLERLSDNAVTTRLAILGSLGWRARVRAVIYNSEHAALEHERWLYPRARRIIIPNGFDLEAFRPDQTARATLRGELGLASDAVVVGRIARDDAIKDTPNLVRAFAALPFRDVHLVLAGRGMDSRNALLLAELRSLGIGDRVHLLGERRDIARLNAGFDLAVLSSSHGEGFPNVVCEAMAAGTPIVSTDAGECRAIIGDPSRIAPIRDPQALGAVMTRVLALTSGERMALGRADRERVSRLYSLPAVAESYAALWHRIAGKQA
ncbi:MAG TPA: glycosyltransferase [Beijerinckiaceae bacterium]|nr:glycosyltransferase [Beijerinckiaceae bacterium]